MTEKVMEAIIYSQNLIMQIDLYVDPVIRCDWRLEMKHKIVVVTRNRLVVSRTGKALKAIGKIYSDMPLFRLGPERFITLISSGSNFCFRTFWFFSHSK